MVLKNTTYHMNKFNISHTCLKHEFKKIKQATSVNPSKNSDVKEKEKKGQL